MQTKEQHRRNNLKIYHKKREAAISFLGGKCEMCGSTNNLEIDHIKPDEKELAISRHITMSEETIKQELQKCQLLCKSCHLQKSKIDGSHPNLILDQERVNLIREEYKHGSRIQEICIKYDIRPRTAYSIIHYERWK